MFLPTATSMRRSTCKFCTAVLTASLTARSAAAVLQLLFSLAVLHSRHGCFSTSCAVSVCHYTRALLQAGYY